MNHFRIFHIIGIAEAISYLLLLGLAMPLKYMMDMPWAVKYTGWAHGLLFILYLIWLLLASDEQGWGWREKILGFVASLVPFGPFLFHSWVKKAEV